MSICDIDGTKELAIVSSSAITQNEESEEILLVNKCQQTRILTTYVDLVMKMHTIYSTRFRQMKKSDDYPLHNAETCWSLVEKMVPFISKNRFTIPLQEVRNKKISYMYINEQKKKSR